MTCCRAKSLLSQQKKVLFCSGPHSKGQNLSKFFKLIILFKSQIFDVFVVSKINGDSLGNGRLLKSFTDEIAIFGLLAFLPNLFPCRVPNFLAEKTRHFFCVPPFQIKWSRLFCYFQGLFLAEDDSKLLKMGFEMVLDWSKICFNSSKMVPNGPKMCLNGFEFILKRADK